MTVIRTLHGAGNDRALHRLACHPGVDAIEADVWLRDSTLEAHHERPLPGLPLLIGRNGLRRRRQPITLDELAGAVQDCSALLLDLRSWIGDPAPAVAHLLLGLESAPSIAVTCESWPTADRLRAWIPELRVSYSVRSERQLRRFIAGRIDGTIAECGIAVRHTLLPDAGTVEAAQRWTNHLAVWTVDDVDRAMALARWGVDEIASNQLIVLNHP